MSNTEKLTCLRLILPAKSDYYVYLDFPKRNVLRETEIPVREDRVGNRFLEDRDIIQFLRDALRQEDLPVFSYWTI